MNLPDCRVHNFILYAHIAPNGKVYFGITSKRLQKRWSNGNGYKNNQHFHNAIQKYGWDSFQHTIIATGLSKEFALFLEQFFISTYKSCDTNFGYNRSIGGDWGGSGYHFNHSDTVKQKLSSMKRGIKHSETHRAHLCDGWLHRKSIGKGTAWNKGVALRDTGMIDNFIEAGRNNAKAKRKRVYQLDKNGNILCEFESVTSAAKALNISYTSGIFAVLAGKQNEAHGYLWRYV